MTKAEKTTRVIRWLTEHHLFVHGGYPHDYAIHAGRLFVADLNDGKERAQTEIRVYDLADLPCWYDRAAKCMGGVQSWPQYTGASFGDWDSAFYETKPK